MQDSFYFQKAAYEKCQGAHQNTGRKSRCVIRQGDNRNMPNLHSAIRGCLLGGAVGDALGYPVEFIKEKEIYKRYGESGIQSLEDAGGSAAVISDDTQMTLFAANALLVVKSNEALDPKLELQRGYQEWLGTQQDYRFVKANENTHMWIYGDSRLHALRAPGNTCLRALAASEIDRVTLADNNSKGCGTVMRAAPFGLITYACGANAKEQEEAASKWAEFDAKLTHGHSAAAASSEVLARTVSRILNCRGEYGTQLEHYIACDNLGEPETEEAVAFALKIAKDSRIPDLDAIHAIGEGWIAEEAVAIAVFAAVRYQNDFRKALQISVNHKGDSDSTGAVCGNILGAWLGEEAVSEAFNLTHLELRDVIETIADDLTRAYEEDLPAAGVDPEWDRKYRRNGSAGYHVRGC